MLVFTLLISPDTESHLVLFITQTIFSNTVDNEWREQRENMIREGPDQLTYSHLAASYYPPEIKDLELLSPTTNLGTKIFRYTRHARPR